MNIYQQYGYKDRNEYLKDLSIEYAIPLSTVTTLANILGEEDFDGLISNIEDYCNTLD